MFEGFLKKNWWQSLVNGTASSGRAKYTLEELQRLSDVLNRNEIVTEANRALVVETIRSVPEFIIWGDQNEPKFFEHFLENNVMLYLHRVLQQPANRTGDVAKQVLQTLSIIIQNIRSETGTYFLFSNNYINNIVEIPFDFEDEEVLGYYISFLKTISLKLNPSTVQFFFDRRDDKYTFPLYSEAVKFAHHREGMVRAGVRTLTLNVYSVRDPYIQDFVCQSPATSYFADMAAYIADQVKILDRRMVAAEGFSKQVLASLDSQLAEVEDMISYVADILTTAHPKLAHLAAQQLWVSLVGPYLLRPLLEHGSSKTPGRSTTGPRGSSMGGTAPGSPGAAATLVRAACSIYCLERVFLLITYPPLLHNLALALLDPRPGHPSCRPAFMALLRSDDHRIVPAALRCLVSIVHNRHLAAEVLALVGLITRQRAADLHTTCTAGGCIACSWQEKLSPLPVGCPAAGIPPDPFAEPARPVATAPWVSGGGGTGPVFGYHVLWTRMEGLAQGPPARHGYGDEDVQGAGATEEGSIGDVGSETQELFERRLTVSTGAMSKPGSYQSDLADASQGAAAAPPPAAIKSNGEVPLLVQGAHQASEFYSAAGGDNQLPPEAPTMMAIHKTPYVALPNPPSDTVGKEHLPTPSQDLSQEVDLLGLEEHPSFVAAARTPQAQQQHPLDPGVNRMRPSDADSSIVSLAATPTDSLTRGIDLLDFGVDERRLTAPSRAGPVTEAAASAASCHGQDTASLFSGLLTADPTQAEPAAWLLVPNSSAQGRAAETCGVTPFEDSVTSLLDTRAEVGSSDAPGPQPAAPSVANVGLAVTSSLASKTVASGNLVDLLNAPLQPSEAERVLGASSIPAAVRTEYRDPLGALLGPADTADENAGASLTGNASKTNPLLASGPSDSFLAAAVDVPAVPSPPPPPPPAPPPPPPPPAPPLAPSMPVQGPSPCSAHGRPAALAASADLLDALFALLSMQLLSVPGLWNTVLLIGELYPRAEEQRKLVAQRAAYIGDNSGTGTQFADLLGVGDGGGNATVAGDSSISSTAVPASPDTVPHPLEPSSTVGWACKLTGEHGEALRVSAVSAATAVLDEVGGMWCDGLLAMLALEWPTARDAVTRPMLRTGAEQLMAGPHLYPKQRGMYGSARNDHGLSGSAVAALHSYHAVARLVALLLLHDLLRKGTTSRQPPSTCPIPPSGDIDAREWDVLEGQEVELQAGSAIPCIVSFSPGQERRVYCAAAGAALRRLSDYLHNPQALLADAAAQAVVMHSSPAVVLADPAPTRLNAGIVLSVAPLLGCEPSVDKAVPKWLHVHVRPSVRGLLRLLRLAASGKKGLLEAVRHLVDGHWVLAFPDAERAGSARQLVEQSAHRLRALYCELLSPVLSTLTQ